MWTHLQDVVRSSLMIMQLSRRNKAGIESHSMTRVRIGISWSGMSQMIASVICMAGCLIGNDHGHQIGDMHMQVHLQSLNAIAMLMPLGPGILRSAVKGMRKRTGTRMVAGIDMTHQVLVHPEGVTGREFLFC